jgi:hypothetical protein
MSYRVSQKLNPISKQIQSGGIVTKAWGGEKIKKRR